MALEHGPEGRPETERLAGLWLVALAAFPLTGTLQLV